ncbi:AMP-binding protein [Rhodococcus sp. NPDC057014]|uniref:AMP-binding protein n=1 Tax=Rhodococcus sp. NPDC057014 TaxID=3346000 RepID=UPI003635136E
MTTPLTPLAFLERSRRVSGTRTAVVDGPRRFTYAEFGERCDRAAGGLQGLGVEPGDRVAVLAPNSVMALEAHYAVPQCGGVLVMLNTRLSSSELGDLIDHSGARILLVDKELKELGGTAVEHAGGAVDIVSSDDYEQLVATAEPYSRLPGSELDLLAINYTSGTTGRPKGVMYNHRGAYLQALAMNVHHQFSPRTRYLWTLPMFHCNGWCMTWAVTASGGTHICIRKPRPDTVWEALRSEGVTNLSAAPTVLTDLVDDVTGRLDDRVQVSTGGAPPWPDLLERLERAGFDVTHLYGLTESYGPAVIGEWADEWDALPADQRARLKARQGVANVGGTPVRVVTDDESDAPADGITVGEVWLRGNNVTYGYYRDPESTAGAFVDGWFRTGDLGVMHSDGFLELRDRSKDVIISGGENIASIEVEQVLASHPGVAECAVVAAPDDRWGEIPVAYVEATAGMDPTAEELIGYVRGRLAHFKAPKVVYFAEIPRTSTGKARKHELRQKLKEQGALTNP